MIVWIIMDVKRLNWGSHLGRRDPRGGESNNYIMAGLYIDID